MDNPAPGAIVQEMTEKSDILIVGGGLNGPALALALAQGGLRVTVIDARPAPDRAQPILQIKASDGLAGAGAAPFFLTFDAAEIEEGPMGFLLEDRFLYSALHSAMSDTPGGICWQVATGAAAAPPNGPASAASAGAMARRRW